MKKSIRNLICVASMATVIAASFCTVSATQIPWNLYNTGAPTGSKTSTTFNFGSASASEVKLSSISGTSAYVNGEVKDGGNRVYSIYLTYNGQSCGKGNPISNGKATIYYHSSGMGSANGDLIKY